MEKKVYGFLVLSIIIGFTIGYLYQINNISTLKLNLKDLEIQSQKEKFNSDSNTKDIENYKNLSEYYKLKSEQYDSCRSQ